jgi:hypothetical protein
MHFCTSAGEGSDRELPGNAVTTASDSLARLELRYVVSNGARQESS